MSFERAHHPRLAYLEAEVAIGSLCNVPPEEVARSVVIATDIDGRMHFASNLKTREIAEFLADALTFLIDEVPEVTE